MALIALDRVRPEPLGLPEVDPAALARAQAFAGRCADLAPTVSVLTDDARFWLTGAQAAVAVALLDGAAVTLHPERVETIAALIDRLSPAFDLIEQRTGIAIEFDDCVRVPGTVVAVTLVLSAHGVTLHLMPRVAPPALSPSVNAALLPVSLAIDAARLPVDQAAGIGIGDMLVLPAAPWAARLTGGGAGPLDGVLDVSAGTWTEGGYARAGAGRTMTSDTTGSSPDFLVPVTLHLPDVAVTVAELAGLTPGGALALGPVVSGLDVDLRVAGRLVARGELVRIGDRFGAVIVDVPGQPGKTDADSGLSPALVETPA